MFDQSKKINNSLISAHITLISDGCFVQLQPANKPHISLVVSPLRALMHDQLKRCEEMGVRALMLNRASDVSADDRQGLFRFILLHCTCAVGCCRFEFQLG